MKYIIKFILISTLLLTGYQCNNKATNPDEKETDEFLIYPENLADKSGFVVINIISNEEIFVDAVQQINGNLYLPVMSSIPDYNKKIVRGIFITDTNYYYDLTGDIFKVTEHLRDTSLGYYGE